MFSIETIILQMNFKNWSAESQFTRIKGEGVGKYMNLTSEFIWGAGGGDEVKRFISLPKLREIFEILQF